MASSPPIEFKHRLTAPCRECPFHKAAPAGWLGPWTPELLVEHLKANDLKLACHMTVPPQDGLPVDNVEQCAGALILGRMACKLPRDKARAAHAERLMPDPAGKHDGVLGGWQQFIDHHRRNGKTSGDIRRRSRA